MAVGLTKELAGFGAVVFTEVCMIVAFGTVVAVEVLVPVSYTTVSRSSVMLGVETEIGVDVLANQATIVCTVAMPNLESVSILSSSEEALSFG